MAMSNNIDLSMLERSFNRRTFLGRTAQGIGGLAEGCDGQGQHASGEGAGEESDHGWHESYLELSTLDGPQPGPP